MLIRFAGLSLKMQKTYLVEHVNNDKEDECRRHPTSRRPDCRKNAA
jgi:hypothetical protein